jgi:hypothetical protein
VSETIEVGAVGTAGKRLHRTAEEKRRILEATLVPGASIAQVAREHGVNAKVGVTMIQRLDDAPTQVQRDQSSHLTDGIMNSPVRRLRMHAFVTGATGFTGTGIVERLIRFLPRLFTAPSTLQTTRGGHR